MSASSLAKIRALEAIYELHLPWMLQSRVPPHSPAIVHGEIRDNGRCTYCLETEPLAIEEVMSFYLRKIHVHPNLYLRCPVCIEEDSDIGTAWPCKTQRIINAAWGKEGSP